MKVLDKTGLLIRYLKTFGAFPRERTPFTTHSLVSLLERSGFTMIETALLGRHVKSLFVHAIKKY